jgi:CHAD domain-containing protein
MSEAHGAVTAPEVAVEKQEEIQPAKRTLDQVLIAQLDVFATNVRAVLDTDDIAALHRARVTTRRLQASLELVDKSPDLDLKKAKQRLQRWRRVLGRVRNYDVYLLLIEKYTASNSRAKTTGLEILVNELRKRRGKHLALARRRLGKIDISELAGSIGLPGAGPTISESESAVLNGVDASAATVSTEGSAPAIRAPGETGPDRFDWAQAQAAVLPGAHAAPWLEHRLRQLHSLAALTDDSPLPRDAHKVRIAAKRVRYLIEVLTEMGYGDASRFLAWLKSAQDRLGDWHDLAALEHEITETVSRRKFLTKHLEESVAMLQFASQLRKRRNTIRASLFPVVVPASAATTVRRITRSLRQPGAVAAQGNDVSTSGE